MRNNPAIGIMGAGAWGTTIAKLLSDKNSKCIIMGKRGSSKKKY
jgi:glycerol-3-phosphate dehydrogenase